MANLENAPGRIVGVRAVSAGPLIFCEAGDFVPAVGDWVLVESNAAVFPARVVLPDPLIETSQLEFKLPKIVGMAAEIDLVEAGISSAVEAAASRKFRELSAASDWPYTLKEVIALPDRLIVNFLTAKEPDHPDYVSILESLAEIAKTRVELYLVKKDSLPGRPPVGPEFVGWVNGLLKPLDPTILVGATVGEPLLDESEVYRPRGQTGGQPKPLPAVNGPGQKVSQPEVTLPVASYDPVKREYWFVVTNNGLTRSVPLAIFGFKYKGSVYTVVINYADNGNAIPYMVKNDDAGIILDIGHALYENVKALEAEIISKIDLWLLDSSKVKILKLGEKRNQPFDRGSH